MGALLSVLGLGSGCATQPEVSWHADVSPMMQQHCTRCHTDGGQGLGDFTDLEQVRTFSDRIIARTSEGTMPPPAADPECRDYVGSDHLFLPDASKAMFERWVDLDMPEGREKDAPDVAPVATSLPDPDLTIMMSEAYTPTFQDPRNPGNEYRCFILDHGQEDDFYVTGFHPVVGEPALVHHVVMFLVDGTDVPADYDPAKGVDCIDGRGGEIGDLAGMVTGWAPGMEPVRLTDSRGIRVGADQRVVMQMHYYQGGGDEVLSDRSGYQLNIAPDVDTVLRMVPLGVYGFTIPAGDPAATATDSFEIPSGVTGKIHAVFPHMHVLGSAYRGWITRDGDDICVAEGRYSFQNQLSYVFKEPIDIQAGDRIHYECTWNNSTSNPDRIHDVPRDTRYGDRTDEEMCFGFTLISIGG